MQEWLTTVPRRLHGIMLCTSLPLSFSFQDRLQPSRGAYHRKLFTRSTSHPGCVASYIYPKRRCWAGGVLVALTHILTCLYVPAHCCAMPLTPSKVPVLLKGAAKRHLHAYTRWTDQASQIYIYIYTSGGITYKSVSERRKVVGGELCGPAPV